MTARQLLQTHSSLWNCTISAQDQCFKMPWKQNSSNFSKSKVNFTAWIFTPVQDKSALQQQEQHPGNYFDRNTLTYLLLWRDRHQRPVVCATSQGNMWLIFIQQPLFSRHAGLKDAEVEAVCSSEKVSPQEGSWRLRKHHSNKVFTCQEETEIFMHSFTLTLVREPLMA